MKVIHKFSLQQEPLQGIWVPKDATILTVQVQRNIPCLWVLLDPNENKVIRKIEIVGTGRELPKNELKYIGTFQLYEGALVFHVFEHIGGE